MLNSLGVTSAAVNTCWGRGAPDVLASPHRVRAREPSMPSDPGTRQPNPRPAESRQSPAPPDCPVFHVKLTFSRNPTALPDHEHRVPCPPLVRGPKPGHQARGPLTTQGIAPQIRAHPRTLRAAGLSPRGGSNTMVSGRTLSPSPPGHAPCTRASVAWLLAPSPCRHHLLSSGQLALAALFVISGWQSVLGAIPYRKLPAPRVYPAQRANEPHGRQKPRRVLWQSPPRDLAEDSPR